MTNGCIWLDVLRISLVCHIAHSHRSVTIRQMSTTRNQAIAGSCISTLRTVVRLKKYLLVCASNCSKHKILMVVVEMFEAGPPKPLISMLFPIQNITLQTHYVIFIPFTPAQNYIPCNFELYMTF